MAFEPMLRIWATMLSSCLGVYLPANPCVDEPGKTGQCYRLASSIGSRKIVREEETLVVRVIW